MDRNRAIGKNGRLPFDCPLDLKRFKQITSGGVCVMGRRTYEDIGQPLSGRTTIVLSRDMDWCNEQNEEWDYGDSPRAHFCTSFRAALDYCHEHSLMEIYVCGGQELYARTIPYISELRATVLDVEIKDADRFYPELPQNAFFQIWKHEFEGGMFSDAAPAYALQNLDRIDF